MDQKTIIDDIVKKFLDSMYPRNQFDYIKNGVCLHIRIPPGIPENIWEKYSSHREALAAFPAIENIEIDPELRGKGFLSHLVEQLYSLEQIESVCLSNIVNEHLLMKVQQCGSWVPLVLADYPPAMQPRDTYYWQPRRK